MDMVLSEILLCIPAITAVFSWDLGHVVLTCFKQSDYWGIADKPIWIWYTHIYMIYIYDIYIWYIYDIYIYIYDIYMIYIYMIYIYDIYIYTYVYDINIYM